MVSSRRPPAMACSVAPSCTTKGNAAAGCLNTVGERARTSKANAPGVGRRGPTVSPGIGDRDRGLAREDERLGVSKGRDDVLLVPVMDLIMAVDLSRQVAIVGRPSEDRHISPGDEELLGQVDDGRFVRRGRITVIRVLIVDLRVIDIAGQSDLRVLGGGGEQVVSGQEELTDRPVGDAEGASGRIAAGRVDVMSRVRVQEGHLQPASLQCGKFPACSIAWRASAA